MITAQYVNRLLAGRIRDARTIAGLTQQQVADRAELSRASVANIELGMQAVTVHQLLLLGRALSVDPISLVPGLEEVDMHDPDDDLIAKEAERVVAASAT
jgi:transcriptional regulator with XRE-family HTH domain